ncbi:helix-turn-helix domain-containing protein [Streptomyces sp. NBC_01236]|uniref:helix-turn-helix domain-containing protein n=1 Tax=Streptomyces sp. NBC_01236 TaxID=2903789 RepID=UPI002E131276|nr:helix-turn-helix transcriptional regulator [Streptomyces sp. NBC_01236]
MTGRTQRWKEIPSERSAELREFVVALRALKDSTGLTQQQIAEAAGMAPTTYSGYLNAWRLPEDEDLERIWKVISEEARQRGQADPYSLDELRSLRENASLCATCVRRGGSGTPSKEPPLEVAAPSELPRHRPAPRVVRGRARRRVHLYGSRRRVISMPPPRAEVPVPREGGDRHLTPNVSDVLAAELRTLHRHQAAGRTRDTHMMLWGKARGITPGEFPETVAAYRAAGFEEEVETLLRTAGAERDVHAVLNIVAALHDSHQYTDAQAILAAARTDL